MNWTIELEDLALFSVALPSPEIQRLLPEDLRSHGFPDGSSSSVLWGFARVVSLSTPRVPFNFRPGDVAWTVLPVQHDGTSRYHLSNLYVTGIPAAAATWVTRLPVRSRSVHLPRRVHPSGRYRWSLGKRPESHVRARLSEKPSGRPGLPGGEPWEEGRCAFSYGGRGSLLAARLSVSDTAARPLRVEASEVTALAEDLQRHHPPDLKGTGTFLRQLTLEVGQRI